MTYTADYLAPCDRDSCDRLARWRTTSDSPTPRVTCDCDTTPRWVDSDGKAVL